MRCNDCTQHVLDGSLNVCTLVEFARSRAHVVYASAWVAGHLGRATQTNAILLQNGFSHFFTVVTCSLLITLTNGRQFYVSVPNNERVRFSHEVFVVGINVNAWLEILWFDHKYNHIHTCVCIRCDLTVSHLLFAVEPPSDLKFKILNENTVEMTWARPSSTIEGFRIQVVSDAGQYGVSTYSMVAIWTRQCLSAHTLYTQYTPTVDLLLNSLF